MRSIMKYYRVRGSDVFSERTSQNLILLLLLGGIFYPTSVYGEIEQYLLGSAYALLYAVLVGLLYLNGSGSKKAVHSAFGIVLLSVIFTISSDMPAYSYGATIRYFPMVLIVCLNLKSISISRALQNGFLLVNVICLACALGIILDVNWVDSFILNWYSAFYDELLRNMTARNEPVTFFASHSISAFMYFWFFYLNFKTWRTERDIKYLMFSFGFLFLLLAVRSSSGIILFVIAFSFVVFSLKKWAAELVDNKYKKIVIVGASVICLALILLFGQSLILYVEHSLLPVLLRSEGGFLGRFGETGVLYPMIEYIVSHPFSPIGFRTDPNLYISDSGIVEMLLRGSLPLLILVHFALYSFISYHIETKSTVFFVLFIIVIAQLGFPYLKYFRFEFFLPFVLVYLQGLEEKRRLP